jgi:purine nucleosidase
MPPDPVCLDVDTGVDDALAVLLALRTPGCDLVGITTVHGNAPLERTTANTLHVLDLGEAPEVPVVSGAGTPLVRPAMTAAEVHGGDGLGGIAATLPVSSRKAGSGAAEFLVATARRFSGSLRLVAVGPLTNIALAIRRDPEALRGIKSLTVMGGAVRVPGNAGPVSEFNFFADPEAAAEVLAARLPLTLLPLDVTEQVVLQRAAVTRARGKLADFVRQLTATTLAFHAAEEGIDGMFLHDPLALAAALDPALIQTEQMALAVETRGDLTAGMVVADLRRRWRGAPNASVGVSVAADRFLRDFFDRVLS